jgi:TonB family protein
VADQENFLEFLKETSKKNVKKIESKPSLDSKKSGKNLSKILSKDLKNIILAGNKLSAGSAITGSSNPQDDSFSPEFRNYFGRIPDLVRKNWKLPSYLAKDQFRCRIRLYIQPSGEVIKAEILESSQSKEYDERAVRSVYASSPFPALPSGSEHHGKQVTIVLVFPL